MIYQTNLLILEKKNPLLTMKVRRYEPIERARSGSVKLSSMILGLSCCNSILFVYRLASLSSLKEFEELLKIDTVQVIILEKTLEEFSYFLSLKEMTSLLEHPRFECYLLEDVYEELYLKIAWQSVFFTPQFITGYEEECFSSFKEKMNQYIDRVFLLASEYSDYGKRGIRNLYCNTSLMEGSKRVNCLRFHKVPAIICGAGPSIIHQLNYLNTLMNKALVFAGGSLLAALPKFGVTPHFAVMVDPDPPYERFFSADFYETPCIYQMRLSNQVLRLVHGHRLLSSNSGEMPVESYYTGLKPLESGWNVANFMATVAAEMGCDPIILIGMDMAYEPDQEYVEGVISYSEDTAKKRELLKTIKGKVMVSRKDLLMGKLFFSELTQRYSHQIFINATEEGLFIDNMNHSSFEEVVESLDEQYDIKAMIHSQVMQMESFQNNKNSSKMIEASFRNTYSILCTMLSKIKQGYLHQKDNLSTRITLDNLVVEEVELEEELVYQLYLNPLWGVWKWVIFRNDQSYIQTVEGKIRQLLFFKEVTEEHEDLFNQCMAKGHKNL